MAAVTQTPPTYLVPPLAPVPNETDAFDLDVTGTIPPELDGRYVRNGPNSRPGEDPGHWWVGHGMLHGIRLQHGRAKWYRNRWVRTRALEGDPFLRSDGSFDRAAVPANTSLVRHDGKLLALVETGLPYVVTPELETIGPEDFGGKLTTGLTAHPKLDPATGELHAFGYQPHEPFLVYHKLSASGDLVTSAVIPGARPTLRHDFAITDRHAIFLDPPLAFDPDGAPSPAMPYRHDDAMGARLGVMPLDQPGTVRWFDMGSTTIFHTGNARVSDDGNRIELVAVDYDSAAVKRFWPAVAGTLCDFPGVEDANPELVRLVIDLRNGAVTRTVLYDEQLEFPSIDEELYGRPNRYTYAVTGVDPGSGPRSAILAYDADRDQMAAHELGTDVVAGEAIFVPTSQPGRAENDGWLLNLTTTRDGRASELLILDAGSVASEPVARIQLPRGVPAGFHGRWLPQLPEDPE